MSRTLFWYIFKDLLKVFLLTSGALAGIMSFGGLLRPLTEHGLGAAQVAEMLSWFMPAMQTYSLPVAALFATTMVYGRLSADNEITACRAAGIPLGLWGMAFPALVLGLVVSLVSFAFLYYIVPHCTLQVEKVIYSNVAQLVANQVERNHRIVVSESEKPVTVFAQAAEVLPPPPGRPNEQVVRLVSPVFVAYNRADAKDGGRARAAAPSDFYIARAATAYLSQDEQTGEITLRAQLEGGAKFPRRYRGNSEPTVQVSIDQMGFFSAPMESRVRENTKFMPLHRLNELLETPENSRRIRKLLAGFIRDDQESTFLGGLAESLSAEGAVKFETGTETYLVERGSAPVRISGAKLVIGSLEDPATPATPPRLRQLGIDGGLDATAREITITATPESLTASAAGPASTANANSAPQRRLNVYVQLNDALVKSGEITTPRNEFPRAFSVPMPSNVAAIEQNRISAYASGPRASPERQLRLKRDMLKLTNSIISEIWARASFSVSCLILVLVGCALGMMFKSGNFLTAFALSVVPAMLCILLIITGQHTCENIPWDVRNFINPLEFGLWMIWAGNIVVAALAAALLWRLQRQ